MIWQHASLVRRRSVLANVSGVLNAIYYQNGSWHFSDLNRAATDVAGNVTTDSTGKVHQQPIAAPHRVVSPDAAVKVTQALEQVIEDGYRFLMSLPVKRYDALERGRELTGRR